VAPRHLQRVDNSVGWGGGASRSRHAPPGGGTDFMISENHAEVRKTPNRAPTPSRGLRALCGHRVGCGAPGARRRTSCCPSATDVTRVDPRSCCRTRLYGSHRRCHTGGATPPSRRGPELEALALGSSCAPRRHAAAQTLSSWRLSTPPRRKFLDKCRRARVVLRWGCGSQGPQPGNRSMLGSELPPPPQSSPSTSTGLVPLR